MKLSEHIHIVASGDSGLSLTNGFDCTVYLIDGGSECALVDAGVGIEPERIASEIQAAGFSLHQVKKILLTHGHGDHAGGATALAALCEAKVYAMEQTAQYVSQGDLAALSLQEAIEAGVYAQGYTFTPCPVIPLADGDIVMVGTEVLTVIAAEGHSAGHCCYQMKENDATVLFAGDSIQCGGKIALQAIWDCDLQKYIKTILRLAEIYPDMLLPAHGCVALQRGWRHTDKARDAVQALMLPKNSIGE